MRNGPALAIAFALASEALAAMKPRVIETRCPTDDVVIASLVVEAPKDGTGDATGAIQEAIDQAAAAGGAVVFLPPGRYRLAGRLTLKEGVTLRGDYTPNLPQVPKPAGGYSILMPTADKGTADGPPAITMERGTGLTNLAIWYPDQDPMKIVPYPWTIRTSEKATGDNLTIQNVALINPYQAIKIGPEWNELHTIRNVVGTPLKAGIWIDTCTDIGRLADVAFGWECWQQSGLPGSPATGTGGRALREFTLREGVAFEVRRSDWQYADNVQAAAYAVGMVLRPGLRGTANAVVAASTLAGRTALLLEGLNKIGLSVASSRLFGQEHALHAPGSFSSTALLNDCRVSGAVLLNGRGKLAFQGCDFTDAREAPLEARSGQLSLLGCLLLQEGSRVRLAGEVRRARLIGNDIQRAPSIESASRGDVMLTRHRFWFPRHSGQPRHAAPPPRPAGKELFLVTDFGAGAGEQDNTAAFAKALEAAQKAGGGTVYVPAGNYRFAGEIVVPAGVELRGIFDVPHHTVSGGSVLMPTSGKGKADGTPFIRLEAKSGLRGITIWYPDQDLRNIQPYPWAVQSLGPGCWLVDVTLGNAYQGADFWTHPSDRHVIRYLAGAVFKRGLFVSKCKGDGWVEDVHFNPHYSVRLHHSLTSRRLGNLREVGEKDIQAVIAYQRANLEGIVFGRCEREHVRGTFIYAAYDGIAFRDDGGSANATVINHGTDTGSRCAVLSGSANVTFVNAQLVPLGAHEVGAIIVEDSFKGKASFFNTQIWGGRTSGIIAGSGDVLIQGVNTLCGPFILEGGRVAIENAHWTRDLPVHIRVGPGVESARLIANLAPNELKIEDLTSRRLGNLREVSRLYARCNSLAIPPAADRLTFKTGFEPGEPQPAADSIAQRGGGIRSVSKPLCRVADAPHLPQASAPAGGYAGGKRALRVSGIADDPAYSHVYFRLFEEAVGIAADSVLSYWIRPANERGRCIGLDLLFADGSTLRDSGAKTADGRGVHPGNPRGEVGKWTKIAIPLGHAHAGKAIAAILVAYDSRAGGGPFEAWIDDIALESAQPAAVRVTARPAGGAFDGKVAVTLAAPAGSAIRYSLDGLSPTAESPRYERPIVLDRPGLWELRFAAFAPDGRPPSPTLAELYEIR